MGERMGDESVILRIAGLQNGKIQFTDTTNAERLFKEFGNEVRYNAAWKK